MVKTNSIYSSFVGILVMYIQFYLVLIPLLVLLLSFLFHRFVNQKQRRVYFVAAGTLCTLILLEVGAMFYLKHADRAPAFLQNAIWHYYEKYDYKIIQFTKGAGVHDPELFYRLKPSSSFTFENHEFTDSFYTNSRGLRDDEPSLQSPEIICLGDSYFMGWGVKQDSTFSSLLEKKSGSRVLNAAISSYGTARELKLLSQLDRSNMKYLVIQYCVNDWAENKSYLAHQNKLEISSSTDFDRLQKEHQLSRLYFPGKHSALLGHLLLRFSVNRLRKTFKLPFDRFKLVTDEQAQARDFLEVLLANKHLFTNSQVIITLMDSQERIDNHFLSEVDKLLQTPRFVELYNQTTLIRTGKMFRKEDFHFLDQHAKGSAYEKLSTAVLDSIRAR